jgi:hypothetical protein
MEHPDNAFNREYCRHFWDRIEQDMLQAYRSLIAEQVEHPLSVFAVVEHRMELALRSFMRYNRRVKSWRRLQEAEVYTRVRVDRFCGNVMVCVSLGRGELRHRGVESVWVQRLQSVMAVAQTMFANINKEITVRLVEFDGRSKIHHSRTHIINAKHTIQEAVTQEYTAFPGVCQMINVRRALDSHKFIIFERPSPWSKEYTPADADATSTFFTEDIYPSLRNRDTVDIVVDGRKPGGPQAVAPDHEIFVGPMDDPYNWSPVGFGGGRGPDTLQDMRTCLQNYGV